MIDGLFDRTNYVLAKKMLDYTSMRHVALSSNIANVETPNYNRMDIAPDFKTRLMQAASTSDVERIGQLEPKLLVDESYGFLRGDGNNVELDHELMEMTRNSTSSQFLTQYVSGSIKQLKAAINGKVS